MQEPTELILILLVQLHCYVCQCISHLLPAMLLYEMVGEEK